MEDLKRSKRKRIPKQPFDDDFTYDPPKHLKKPRRRKQQRDAVKLERGPYQCEHCHHSFEEEQQLIEHEEVHFETEHVNECGDCGLVFASKISLLSHQRAKHKEDFHAKNSRFICPECNKSFLQKSGLRTHMSIHTGEKPFKCGVCSVGFRLNSSLQRHICREHYSYKPYKCEQCGKNFGHNSDMVHHIRSVHAKERLFVCQICNEKFTTNVVLMRHINIHFELKLNECKVCGARFSHNGSLYNHMKVHSDERAYQCQECGKSYKLKSHLKNHRCKISAKRTHQNESASSDQNKDDSDIDESNAEVLNNGKSEDLPTVLKRQFQLQINYPASVDSS